MDSQKNRIEKESFLATLYELNEKSGVDPEVIELLIAYVKLRINNDKTLNLYVQGPGSKSPQGLDDFLKKNNHLDSRSSAFLSNYFLELHRKGLVTVFNREHLASILDTPLEKLENLSSSVSNSYSRFQISKKSGGEREILAPYPELKLVQRRILDDLLQWVPVSKHAEGYRKNKSILSNAQHHVGKTIVVKIDLKDFFPTITFSRVKGVFSDLGYPEQVSKMVADLTTYRGRLPIGSPASPAISNIICRKMDARFSGLGKKLGFSYSRYADDLAFSSDNSKLLKNLSFIESIIVDEGFVINKSKYQIVRNGRRQRVTGIVVNEKPNIARESIRNMRATLHNCKKYGFLHEAKREAKIKNLNSDDLVDVGQFKRSLLVKINHVKMVNDAVGINLLSDFNKAV